MELKGVHHYAQPSGSGNIFSKRRFNVAQARLKSLYTVVKDNLSFQIPLALYPMGWQAHATMPIYYISGIIVTIIITIIISSWLLRMSDLCSMSTVIFWGLWALQFQPNIKLYLGCVFVLISVGRVLTLCQFASISYVYKSKIILRLKWDSLQTL